MSLPIQNHPTPCLLAERDVPWFNDKTLLVDDEGVHYVVAGRRYSVHEQVMVIACKDGRKQPLPAAQMMRFVRARCSPDVQRHYFGNSGGSSG